MPTMRESDLLKKIFAANTLLPDSVTLPPGDDMGALRIGNQQVLVTIDQLIESIHFEPPTQDQGTPIEKIGRKAMTRNLSDVAAMAAQPVGAVAAACLNDSLGADRAEALFEAMRKTAQQFSCPLFGGDVSIWAKPTVLTITVIAQAAGIGPILRSTAMPGDKIYVTGKLGGSLETIDGYTHHLDFEPRIELARTLGSQFDIHAMIDLSDGLARDLGHICKLSNVRAEISTDCLPISDAALLRAKKLNCPPWQCALGDGEDYELCFTADPNIILPEDIDGVQITAVGVIAELESPSAQLRPTIGVQLPDGSHKDVTDLGWEHHD
jgi:thiamine-monophosphate kinase